MRRALAAAAVAALVSAGSEELPIGLVDAAAHEPPVACDWPLKSDPDAANVAFPDEGATYWVAGVPCVPGSRLIIRGRYPSARYFSFHAYDSLSRPVDGLADFEIDPDPGGSNPFTLARARPGDSYTVEVQSEAQPAEPERNMLYAGATHEGAPNPAAVVLYRVYVADDPADPAGDVPLPEITLESDDGAAQVALRRCQPLPPATGLGVNDAIRESSFPDAAPRVIPHPTAQDPPHWSKFFGVGAGGGVLSSEHVAYGLLALSRQHGDLVVLRGKAPTFPDTRAGEPVTRRSQLRYWSLCQNELATQRYVACLADHQTLLDRKGWFTLVVSDPVDRPANATAEHRVTWLPCGGAYYDGLVIYRHMLPAPSFGQAWQGVSQGVEPAEVMGDYLPRAAYCTREVFEATGWRGCLS